MKLSIFFADTVGLSGIDIDTGNEYRISFCGNGASSHYVLRAKSGNSFYVMCNDKDYLYRLIRHAEMTLVFKAKPCCFCRVEYVGQDQLSCTRCWHSAWLRDCLTRRLFT